jgi:basic membrane protein A and related proteins
LTISKRLLGLGASAAIILAACGPSGATTAPATSAPATTAPGGSTAPASAGPTTAALKTVACVAFDTGGLGDKGFNDLAKKGLEDAAAAGFTTYFSEAKGATDYANNIQTLVDKGCTAIVTVGFLQTTATVEGSALNPTVAFAQVDTSWGVGPDFTPGTADDVEPANYTGLDYQVDQAAMLAGYLGAAWTKSGKIGTYGGLAFPGVTRFMDGLYAGIQWHNEHKGTTVALIGWDGANADPVAAGGAFVGGSGGNDTWGDPAKGEQLAKTLLDQGVDIVHPVAGATGNGSIKAMQEAGKWAIGVDTDQWISIGPPTNAALLTSAQKAIDVSVLDFFNRVEGGYLGGSDYSGTLRNGGVLISPYHDYDSQFSAELKAEIEDLKTQLSDGTLTVCRFLGARAC